MVNNDVKALISLAASAVNQKKPDLSIIHSVDFDALYNLAFFHDITAIIDYALESVDLTVEQFKLERESSICRTLVMDYDREAIFAAFEKEGIWYMPMKGVILTEYYPQPGMRQMSDNDILFDEARSDDVKAIMERLGFTTVSYGLGHQDDYRKPPVSYYEMHRMLFAFSYDDRLYNYYKDIPQKLVMEDGFKRHFTNEDFYLYMIAHEFKHFYWNGIGLRSLIDVYVFLQKFNDSLNWDYIR